MGCEPLEPRIAFATFYVDDAWGPSGANLAPGAAITDADLLAPNNQAAIFGTTAFATIAEALAAAAANDLETHVIKINTGNYSTEELEITADHNLTAIESLATGGDVVHVESFSTAVGLQMAGRFRADAGFAFGDGIVSSTIVLGGSSHAAGSLDEDLFLQSDLGVSFAVGMNVGGSSAGGQGLTIVATSAVDLREVGAGGALAFLDVQTSGAINLFDDLATTKAGGRIGAITLSATLGVSLKADLSINSAGGDVTFLGAVDGGQVLTIDAGAGDVDFTQAVGAGLALNGLQVTADRVEFDSTLNLVDDLTVDADEAVFAGDATVGGDVSIDVDTQLATGVGADFAVTGSFAQTGTGKVELGGNVVTEGDLSFKGAISLVGGVILSSDANQDGTGGLLTLNGSVTSSVDGAYGLTIIRAGAGAVLGGLGSSTNRLQSLTVRSTSGATGVTKLGGNVFAGAGGVLFDSLVATDQVVELQANATIDSLAGVDLREADVRAKTSGGQSLTITATGAVQLGDVGSPTAKLSTLTVGPTAQSIATQGAILTTSGVSLTAKQGIQLAGDVDGGSGNVTITAALGGGANDFQQTSGVVRTSGAGVVAITNAGAGNLAIGQIKVDPTDPAAKVVLQTGSGSVTDANGPTTNVFGRELVVNVGGAINVQTSVSRLAIDAGAASSIDNAGALQLVGDNAVTGGLTLTVGGALTQVAGDKFVGDLTVSAAGQTISLLGANNDFGTFATTGGAVAGIEIVELNAITLGAINTTGELKVDAGGAIGQSGALVVGGQATFDGTSIDLDDFNNDFADVRFSTAGAASFKDSGAIRFAGGDSDAASLTVTAGGAVTQLSALTISGQTDLTAASVDLSTVLNNLATVRVTTTGDASFKNVDLLTFGGGASSVGGDLFTKANGGVAQTGAISVSGQATFLAPSIDLDDFNNDFNKLQFSSTGAADFKDANGLTLAGGASNAPVLTITAGGVLTQAAGAPLTVSGQTTLTAASVVLDVETNNLNALAVTTTGDASFKNVDALSFSGGATSVGGDLDVTAGGNVTQLSAISVTGTATFSVGANDVVLANGANDFGAVAVAAADDVSITDADDLVLAGLSIAGNLVVATTGNVTQSAELSIDGTASFTTGNNDVVLTDPDNAFGGAVNVTSTNDATIVDSNSLTLGNVVLTGNLSATGAGITQTGAAITVAGTTTLDGQGGDAILGGASNSFVGSVSASDVDDLTIVDTAGDLTFGNLAVGGNLVATAAANVVQEAGSTITVAGTSLLTAGTNDSITLDEATNDFGGTVTIGAAQNVSLADANNLRLAALALSGDLTLDAGGAITQTGAFLVQGQTTLAAASVDLDDFATNDFNTLTVDATGNVSISEESGFVFSGGASTVGGSLTVVSTGSVTQTDALTVTLLARFTAANVDLDDAANDFNDVRFSSAGAVSFRDVDDIAFGGGASGAGTLSIDAGGAVTQTASVTVSGQATFVAASVDLDDVSNDFAVVRVTTTGAAAFKDSNALVFGGGASTVGGGLSVNAGGALTQTDVLSVTGQTTITAGSVDLDDFNNDFDSLRFTVTGAASFKDADGLAFAGGASSSAGLTITAGGAITQTSALAITGQTTISAASVDLDDATNDFDSLAVTTAGNASFKDADGLTFAGGATSVGGNLAVTTNGAVAQSSVISVTGTTSIDAGGADVTLANAGNDFGGAVSLTNVDDVSLADANTLTLGASTVGGGLTLAAGGDLLQTGAISVGGPTSLTAGAAGAITFNDANNDFTGAVTITQAATAAISDKNALTLGDATVAGAFALVAGGNVTQQTGTAITAGATTISTTGDVTLANANNDFASVAITAAVNASVRDKNALVLAATTVTGTLAVQTGGALTQSGALSVGGAASFTAATGDVILSNAGNDFQGSVSANVANGSFTVVDSGALQLGNVLTGVDFNAASGGPITQAGGTSIQVDGTTTLTATGDVVLNNPGNDFVGPVNVASAVNVSIADANDLTLGSVNATGSLNVSVGGTLSLGGTISTGLGQTYTGNVLLAADTTLVTATGDVVFNGTINGGFLLTVTPAGDATFNGAIGGTTPLAGLDVTADDVTFGSTVAVAAQGVAIDAVNASFAGDVTTTAGGAVAIDVDALLTIAPGADFNLDGAFTQTGAGTVSLGGDVVTTNDAISFAGAITLTAGVVLDSGAGTGADITLAGAITGGGNALTLDAGPTGDIDVQQAAIGLGAVVIVNAADVDFQNVSAVSLTQQDGQGTTTFNGTVSTSGAAGVDLAGNNFTFNGVVTTTGGGGVSIDNSGLLDVNAAINSDGAVTQTGTGNVQLGANVTTTGDLVSFAGAVALDADVVIATANGAVTFANTLDGNQLLTVAAGNGNVSFQGAVGGGAALTGIDATGKNVSFGSTVAVDAQGLSITAVNASFADDVTTTTGGAVVISVTTQLTIAVGADFNLDGAFTQTGAGSVSLGGNVATTNDAISFAGAITLTAGVTLDSGAGTGADVTLGSTVAGGGNSLTIDAGGAGNVLFAGAATGLGAVTIENANDVDFQKLSAVSLTQLAGQGTTTFNGSVTTSGAAGINLTGNNFTLDGTITTTGGGAVVIDNAGLLDVNKAISADGAVTQIGTGDVELGANVTTTGDLVSFAGAVTLDADVQVATSNGAVTFANTLDGNQLLTILAGSGDVSFQQAVGGTTALSGLSVTGGNVAFDSTAALDDQGLSVTAANATFNGAVTTTTGGSVAVSVSGLLTIVPGADFTLDGSFTQTGSGAVSLGGNVVTTNDSISFAGAITLTDDIILRSDGGTGANVILSKAITGAGKDLTIDAGTAGDVVFSQSATGLDVFTLESADDASFQVLSATSITQLAGQGTTTFNGSVTTSGAAGVNLTGNNFTFDGTVTTTGTGGVTVNNAGLLDVNAAINSDGAVTQVGAGPVELGANVTTTGDLVSILSATTIDGAVVITTAGGNATFFSTVNGDVAGRNLTLDLGAGDATFAGAVGATTALGTLTLASVDDASFQSVRASSIVQTVGTGTTVFNGAVTTLGAGGVNLTGNNITFLATVTAQSSGSVVIDNAGLLTIAVGANVTVGGNFNQIGAGDVDFGATVQTSGGFATFTGDVELIGTAAVRTAGGNASFLGAVDGAQNFTVQAGSGDVLFDAAVGATTPLGALVIQSADDLTFNGSVSAASLAQNAGSGVTTFNGAIATTGAAGVDLNGNVFLFNNPASVTTTGSGGLAITNAGLLSIAGGADFNLDGAFLQDGTGDVQTAGDVATTNDAITWQSNVTLVGNVAFSSGAGTITFFRQFLVGSRTASFTSTTAVQLGASTQLEGGLVNSTSQLVVGAGEEVIGRGTVMASLLIGSGGSLSPGSVTGGQLGTLTIDTLTLAAGSRLAVQWRGQAAGQFDQVRILSDVNAAGSRLDLVVGPGFFPAIGQNYRLIDNVSGNAVAGTFAGLPNGSVFSITTADGAAGRLAITYLGGTGNDVVVQVFQQPFFPDTTSFEFSVPVFFIPVPTQSIPVVLQEFRQSGEFSTIRQTTIDAGEFKIALRIEEVEGRGSNKVVRTVYNNVIPSSDLVATLRLLAREPWGYYRITIEVVDPLRPDSAGEVIEIELNADNQEKLFRDLDSVWDVLEYTPPWRDPGAAEGEEAESVGVEPAAPGEAEQAAAEEDAPAEDAPPGEPSSDAFDLVFSILPATRPLAALSALGWAAPAAAAELTGASVEELSDDLGERLWQQWPASIERGGANAWRPVETDAPEADAADELAAAALAAPLAAAVVGAAGRFRRAGERGADDRRGNERAGSPFEQDAAGRGR